MSLHGGKNNLCELGREATAGSGAGFARALLGAPTLNTATLGCSVLVSSPGRCVGHILERKLGRRLKLSGPALGRCPCMMEMLLQSPALSQQCPRPVPACSPWAVTQQHWDRADRALRPETNAGALQGSVEVKEEGVMEEKPWGSLAVRSTGVPFSPPALPRGADPAAPEKSGRKDVRETRQHRVLYFVSAHTYCSAAPRLYSLWVTLERQIQN